MFRSSADSLLKFKKEGMLREVHFTNGRTRNRYAIEGELSDNVIAYRMVRRDPVLKALTTPMQLYFLGERRHGSWNTYSSSSILTAVLPDLIADGARKDASSVVKLSGKTDEDVTKFPYRIELEPGEELNVRKNSGAPVYLVQYGLERVVKAKSGVADVCSGSQCEYGFEDGAGELKCFMTVGRVGQNIPVL